MEWVAVMATLAGIIYAIVKWKIANDPRRLRTKDQEAIAEIRAKTRQAYFKAKERGTRK
jgi:hypothetical protein